MKQLITPLAIALLLGSCGISKKGNNNLNKEKMETVTELSNKEKAIALLNAIQTGASEPVGYINASSYKQHNLAIGDGLAGFGAVLQSPPEGGFKVNVIRAYQDGDYVFAHTKYDFFGDKIGFDIFKFENGLIVEHWDNLTALTPSNPSGHTQTDGPIKSEDKDKTEANKTLVKDFIATILMKGEMDKLGNFFDGDNYIQHNSAIADGLSGLGAALEGMAKQGISMIYDTNHIVLGEGNMVLAISEGQFAGEPTSYYDLFRVENGKIAEHWDVMETILPESERKNNNGKFNF